MTQFLLERYVPRANDGAIERDAERARLSAEALTLEGTPVRYLRSIFVPDDETCFLLYEAGSVEAVRAAALRAALPFERISLAIGDEHAGGTARLVGTGKKVPRNSVRG
jgi:hypothetical protein